ncbi:Zinc/iron permease [Pseudoneurospora amorphoporcata]|uniref:Zinc/iron permease n=1 Tax=Pseudoneurospora amorphoporcata TaxID=241081 RepID=A0AAN6NQR3_9PEZI|nr:Zinc/iron permease [Pseudoneurospora amorphoporcata]
MGNLLILLALCVVMALASFFAGALPLSLSLSQSQLRLISSIGVGILVGTSLIVIIPEGIEAVATTNTVQPAHSHNAAAARRSLMGVGGWSPQQTVNWRISGNHLEARNGHGDEIPHIKTHKVVTAEQILRNLRKRRDEEPPKGDTKSSFQKSTNPTNEKHDDDHDHHENGLPTFQIGLSLILGFALMFLIDRLPQHAFASSSQSGPQTRHISLDNLETSSISESVLEGRDGSSETDGFLSSFLSPSPKQARTLATTVGLVIHAAADGIAMGASATTEDMRLGFIIFVAIMVHKAPAAFGLTSVLLRQGLSKRAARGHLIVFSAAAPVGALVTYCIVELFLGGSGGQVAAEGSGGEQWWTGILLLFSAGTFL